MSYVSHCETKEIREQKIFLNNGELITNNSVTMTININEDEIYKNNDSYIQKSRAGKPEQQRFNSEITFDPNKNADDMIKCDTFQDQTDRDESKEQDEFEVCMEGGIRQPCCSNSNKKCIIF